MATHQTLEFRILSVASRVSLKQNTSFEAKCGEYCGLCRFPNDLITELLQVASSLVEPSTNTRRFLENILSVWGSSELGDLCEKCVPMQRHSDECRDG